MARSQRSLPRRLTTVDAVAPDHWHLTASDECYFLGEYTARTGYQGSPTNQLVLNLKKRVDRRGLPDWHYKGQAIREVATALRAAINHDFLDKITFVPIPPSRAKDDRLYDDRMTQVCAAIRPRPPLDVRELIVQPASTPPAHGADDRPTPQDIEALYQVDAALAYAPRDFIFIVDDVLTTGAHFVAAKSVLTRLFPTTPVVGVFVARRVPTA